MKKSVQCKEMGNGIEVDFKKGSWLYLKPITKAHNKLCWESPLAVLMRIKRLSVHSSGLREVFREEEGEVMS